MTGHTLQIAIAHQRGETRNTLHAAVAQLGHAVCLHAASGDELVRRGRMQRPDLFIVQEYLPDMDGLEAVEKTAGSEAVPVVVVLDRHDGAAMDRPEWAHVLGVLQDPVRQSDLIPVIPLAIGHFTRLQRQRERIASLKSEIDAES